MTTTEVTAGRVQSADGTTIAFERSGSGPALILVDGAGCYRELGPLRPLAALLAADFSVITFDRRGRGESGDTLPYAVDREVDDIAALIAVAGEPACLYTVSSGGLLAMHAAASGLAIRKLALFEPPINTEADLPAESTFTGELAELITADRRREAVEYFHRGIGVPQEIIDQMGPTLPAWEAIAHTLVYDCRLSDATSVALARAVTAPTLVIDSQGSSGDLTGWAAALVQALPDATHRSLVGKWHGVPDEDIAPVLTDWFKS